MILRLPIGLVGSNTYLVYDEENGDGVIVDPGGETQPLLDEIGQRRVRVRYILNTHGHFDHIAANAAVKAQFDVPLGLHPADQELLLHGGGAALFGLNYVPSPPPDLELVEGLRLEIGALHLQVLHTPGHTPGSVCLYIPEESALLTGDTLFASGVGRTDLPGGDARQLTESLRRLLALPPETTVYSGHGSSTTLSAERRHNPWLRRLSPLSSA